MHASELFLFCFVFKTSLLIFKVHIFLLISSTSVISYSMYQLYTIANKNLEFFTPELQTLWIIHALPKLRNMPADFFDIYFSKSSSDSASQSKTSWFHLITLCLKPCALQCSFFLAWGSWFLKVFLPLLLLRLPFQPALTYLFPLNFPAVLFSFTFWMLPLIQIHS